VVVFGWEQIGEIGGLSWFVMLWWFGCPNSRTAPFETSAFFSVNCPSYVIPLTRSLSTSGFCRHRIIGSHTPTRFPTSMPESTFSRKVSSTRHDSLEAWYAKNRPLI